MNHKFIGEIERGLQNPSFNTLVKIADGLDIELPELFRFEQEIFERRLIEVRVREILKALPDDSLRQALLFLRVLYPIR